MKHQSNKLDVIDGDVFFSQLDCLESVLLIHILKHLDISSLFMLYITSKMTHSLIDKYSSQLGWKSFKSKEEQVSCLIRKSIECHYLEHVKFYAHGWPQILDPKNMPKASQDAMAFQSKRISSI
jgi:hypothetical protein